MIAFITLNNVKTVGIRKDVPTVFLKDGIMRPIGDVVVVDSVLRDVRINKTASLPVLSVTLAESDRLLLVDEEEIHQLEAGTEVLRAWENGEATLVAVRRPGFRERAANRRLQHG